MKPNHKVLDLRKVQDAREYIQYFQDVVFGKHIDYIDTTSGRISLTHMSDEDALTVAPLLHDMETEAAFRRAKKKGGIQ